MGVQAAFFGATISVEFAARHSDDQTGDMYCRGGGRCHSLEEAFRGTNSNNPIRSLFPALREKRTPGIAAQPARPWLPSGVDHSIQSSQRLKQPSRTGVQRRRGAVGRQCRTDVDDAKRQGSRGSARAWDSC
jgi:hypothetical protein